MRLRSHVEYGKWWRVKAPFFHFFWTATRLVALVPISSAMIERIFLQVKYIVETIGENALEETLQTRVMEQVNNY